MEVKFIPYQPTISVSGKNMLVITVNTFMVLLSFKSRYEE